MITPRSLLEPGVTSSSALEKISGLMPISGAGAGVVVPADGDAGVVEAFGADQPEVIRRVVDAPVLAREGLQARCPGWRRGGTAGRPGGRAVSRRRSASSRRKSGGPDGAGAHPDRHRTAEGNVHRRVEGLVVPRPGVMGPADRGDAGHLSDNRPAAAPSAPGLGGFKSPVAQLRALDPDLVPEDFLLVEHPR